VSAGGYEVAIGLEMGDSKRLLNFVLGTIKGVQLADERDG
jgi:hypothetical protein